MRMLHVFALVISFNLFACVTDDEERGSDTIAADDVLGEELGEVPDIEADLANIDGRVLLEHEPSRAVDALTREPARDLDVRPRPFSEGAAGSAP